MLPAQSFCRLEANAPLIKGHGGPIVDFDFSPFNDSLLYTASEDGSVKLWIIPPEGVTQDVSEHDAELKGHAKKLILAKFHPCADYTMGTAAADGTIRIWDITGQKCALVFDEIKGAITGLEWSHNGSLLGTTAKDKTVNIFDPRQGGPVMSATSHEGARP